MRQVPRTTSIAAALGGGRLARPRLLTFLGPATLVAVGYMDPGNWATDLEGGARFGCQLLWVLVASNWIAMLLQTLATRLGVATDFDLAEACRIAYSRWTSLGLWVLAELAIVACDVAEVIGSAIALNLLFSIPMIWGAVITVLDVFVILALQRRGMRALESVVIPLILTIAGCFAIQLYMIHPPLGEIGAGLIPHLTGESIYIAIGIVGATVMPHNLYLHASVVKSRNVEPGTEARRTALKGFLVDTTLSLHIALLVNAAILIFSAAVFGANGIVVDDLRDAFKLLTPLLGTQLAAILFAIALLCAGQSATITGTLAGQIVMSGFLERQLPVVARRLVTRAVALVPAIAVLAIYGDRGTMPLLIGTQVVLSLQLPFAIIPLVRVTASKAWMGDFQSGRFMTAAAFVCAGLIVTLNVVLVARTAVELMPTMLPAAVSLAMGLAAATVFLVYIARVPLRLPEGTQSLGGHGVRCTPRGGDREEEILAHWSQ